MSAMPVTFPECCAEGCFAESEWGFKPQIGDPYADDYCCSSHLATVMCDDVTLVWPIALEWPVGEQKED